MARPKKSKGLGDTIEKVTKATGIKAVVDKISEVTGIDCGCDARKEALNKLWSYKKVECINDTDMLYLNEFFKANVNQLTIKQQTEIKAIYKNIFNISLEDTSCASCWRDYIGQIKQVYDLSIE
jgi:hypothetical protein